MGCEKVLCLLFASGRLSRYEDCDVLDNTCSSHLKVCKLEYRMVVFAMSHVHIDRREIIHALLRTVSGPLKILFGVDFPHAVIDSTATEMRGVSYM